MAIKKQITSTPLLSAFCFAVQERREDLGLSQEELASRAGLHRTYISDIERGSRNLSLKSLSRLAEALEIPLSTLLHFAEVKAATGVPQVRRRLYIRDSSTRAETLQVVGDRQSNGDDAKEHLRTEFPENMTGEQQANFLAVVVQDMASRLKGANEALELLLSSTTGKLSTGQRKVVSIVKEGNDFLLSISKELLEFSQKLKRP